MPGRTSTRRGFLCRLGAGSLALAPLPLAALERTRRYAGADALPLAPLGRPTPDEAYWSLVRAQFPIRPGLIPLNAANLCPAPRSVIDAAQRAGADVDADVSFQNRAKYDELREATRRRLAEYLGASSDEIAMVRNNN